MKSILPLFLLTTVALSSCTSGHSKKMFRALDADRDGKVTAGEFSSHLGRESFRVLDANRDNRISLAEWTEKETESTSAALFRKLDSDRSGSLDIKEFTASEGSAKRKEVDAVFHTIDRNRDGGLEWNEIKG